MDDRELVRIAASVIGREAVMDDCAAIDLDGIVLLATTDMLHERTDFPPGMSARQYGWMAAAVSLSDLAGSGAVPVALLMAVGLDDPGEFDEILRGADTCCRQHGTRVVGGDVDRHDELTIVTTALGIAGPGGPVTRSGASPGELLCLVGKPGRAQAALEGHRQHWESLVEPRPLVTEGLLLARAGVTAMMDVSDGLLISLHDMAAASGCGFEVDSSQLPLPAGVEPEEARRMALSGGGDYGLLFTCRPGQFPVEGVNAVAIGGVTVGELVLVDGEAVEPAGYLHHWQ